MAKTTSRPKVWIAWSPDGDLENVRALTYGDGACRVYERDRYDGRIGYPDDKPIPYFRWHRAACAFMVANPGKQCQVDTRSGLFAEEAAIEN